MEWDDGKKKRSESKKAKKVVEVGLKVEHQKEFFKKHPKKKKNGESPLLQQNKK